MTKRRIELHFVGREVSATAALLQERAPQTCRALWAILEEPLLVDALHGMRTGRTIDLGLPAELGFDPDSIPVENATSTPLVGDLVWMYVPRRRIRSLYEGVCGILVAYGPEGVVRTPLGLHPGNVWAQIEGNAEPFYRACGSMWVGGARTMRIARL